MVWVSRPHSLHTDLMVETHLQSQCTPSVYLGIGCIHFSGYTLPALATERTFRVEAWE